jgi:HD-GYP domain-containing protein (c-di-GMP phosphodiesterase class II)
MDDRYKYAEEKFSQARRYLMLPPAGKEALVISEASHECGLGLRDVPLDDDFEYTARDRVSKLTELIARKDKLSADDKQELCDLINYLAYYFHDRWTGVWD